MQNGGVTAITQTTPRVSWLFAARAKLHTPLKCVLLRVWILASVQNFPNPSPILTQCKRHLLI
jgi:hypothetical protein